MVLHDHTYMSIITLFTASPASDPPTPIFKKDTSDDLQKIPKVPIVPILFQQKSMYSLCCAGLVSETEAKVRVVWDDQMNGLIYAYIDSDELCAPGFS